MSVLRCDIPRLSFERVRYPALASDDAPEVPAPYFQAYDWYLQHEGQLVTITSRGIEPDPELPIPLIAQRGIHKPAGQIYALAVRSSNHDRYEDQPVYELGDGTWIMVYCEHEGEQGRKAASGKYNESLRNCLRDGVPVGVFEKARQGSYRCWGLAFVESYDSGARVFTLHGPVRPDQPADFWLNTQADEALGEGAPLEFSEDVEEEPMSCEDLRTRVTVTTTVREGQGAFRRSLIEAYSGACAITGYQVETVLQAAHIMSYRGPQSHRVSNGLLLRADIHLLFDAHELTICPDDMTVRLSAELNSSPYRELERRRIRLPGRRSDEPSPERLAAHFAEFRAAHRI